ncbi:MAG: hypothetical protein P4M08_01450 [Oligoflexia bacterium]|nr:hypothetical protein [Oligoflexia bacterium]
MKKTLDWIEREILDLIPIWLFFLFAFALLSLTQSVILADYGLRRSGPPMVIIGSLIVAKAFLVADHLRLINWFKERPLIYGVLWKTWIYAAGVSVVWYLEQFVDLLLKHHAFVEANIELIHRIGTTRTLILVVWVTLLLFAFSGTREFIRLFGKARFTESFFGIRRP